MSKVTPFMMFNDGLEKAIEFYVATFPDSEVRALARTGEDGRFALFGDRVGPHRWVAFLLMHCRWLGQQGARTAAQ